MKYLMLIGLLLAVVWLWRLQHRNTLRKPRTSRTPKPTATNLPPTEMVACEVCGVHLPRAEALPGPQGLYCSDAHRRQAQGRA
jgi:uncharacterized protein